jgi:hypothetical protein
MNCYKRQITEKELKQAAKDIRLQIGVIDILIAKVRENQRKHNPSLERLFNFNEI